MCVCGSVCVCVGVFCLSFLLLLFVFFSGLLIFQGLNPPPRVERSASVATSEEAATKSVKALLACPEIQATAYSFSTSWADHVFFHAW